MGPVVVRPVELADRAAWLRMRTEFWPDDHTGEVNAYMAGDTSSIFPMGDGVVLLAEVDGRPAGFLEVGTRPYADGCDSSPVGYLEGIWVEGDLRRHGVARALVLAGEAWARSRGCAQMASDAMVEDDGSRSWHASVGFREVERVVCFCKDLE